jgi:hypothetical protein
MHLAGGADAEDNFYQNIAVNTMSLNTYSFTLKTHPISL